MEALRILTNETWQYGIPEKYSMKKSKIFTQCQMVSRDLGMIMPE